MQTLNVGYFPKKKKKGGGGEEIHNASESGSLALFSMGPVAQAREENLSHSPASETTSVVTWELVIYLP